ncbi:serine hydrolase domain-containing protein [Granulosicoccus sp. 3-233]|uniref:serine hydrolase domain-containing protein n=1 Tax=Granulosicoccus sp. 3-233 TaxID=3417969 RepID=UPI003D34C946
MKHRHVLTIIAFISSSLLGCSTDSRYAVTEFKEIPGLLEFHDMPGVSIAIIEDFKIDQLITFGVKDRNTLEPVTQDTLFQAASMSKSVTAVAAMKMAQNGMIDLDEDINNELVSWTVAENEQTKEEKVNLRRLLSHTAGTTVHGFSGYRQDEVIPSLHEILNGQAPANSPAVVVDTTPGSQFSYSGGGYVIAQQAMIDVTQQPFEDWVNEAVFEPLAMTSSSFNQILSEERTGRASAGHDTEGQNIPGNYNLYPEMSAAGLWTTPQDLAKLLIELQLSLLNQSNIVLAGDVVEEMITPIGGPIFNTDDLFYGLGFMITRQGDEMYFGHGGNQSGFHSQMGATRSGNGYVVMTNGDNGPAVIDEIVTLLERAATQNAR